jgi:hypothetical protein
MSQAPTLTRRTLNIYIAGFAVFTCCAGIATFGAVYTQLGNERGAAADGTTPTPGTQVAGQTTPLPGTTPTTAPIDDSPAGTDAGITVLEVVDPATPGTLYTPKAGTRLVAIHVVIENIAAEPMGINPINAALLDANGGVAASEPGASDQYSQIPAVDLLPGERADGWVFFAVAEGASAATIKYNSGLTGNELGRAVVTPPTSAPQWSTITAPADLVDEKDGYRLRLRTVVDPAAPSPLYTPVAGTRLIAFEIRLVNVEGAQPLVVNPLNLYLVDDHGFVRQAEPAAAEVGQIETMDVPVGERVDGYVAFKLPEGYMPLYLRYALDTLNTIDGLMTSAIPPAE